jgi:hypothetical protein
MGSRRRQADRVTRNELLAIVPVRWDPQSQREIVALADIPAPWAAQLFIALAGRPAPGVVDPFGPSAFADDWTRWVLGEAAPGPTGLDDS